MKRRATPSSSPAACRKSRRLARVARLFPRRLALETGSLSRTARRIVAWFRASIASDCAPRRYAFACRFAMHAEARLEPLEDRRMLAAGELDPTFDSDGIATTDLGTTDDIGRAVVLQNDGKIIVAGNSGSGSSSDFALVRYNADGSPDTTFGTGGVVTTSFTAGSSDEALAVALQTDGKIVAAGFTDADLDTGTTGDRDFAVVRYNADGTPDSAFDGDGMRTLDFGGEDTGTTVVIQSDGKIVVGGHTDLGNPGSRGEPTHFALVRFNPDGTLDTSFDGDGISNNGNDGTVTTEFNSDDNAQLNALALQSDGKIVAGGFIRNPFPADWDFALARYNTDGTLDTSFGSNGRVTNPGHDHDRIEGLAIDDDGNIIAVGRDFQFFGGDARRGLIEIYSPTGSLIASDISPLDDTAREHFWAVTLQPNGKIVVAGSRGGLSSNTFSEYDFSVYRYEFSGGLLSLDSTFGEDVTHDGVPDGLAVDDVDGNQDQLRGVAIQPDGKIVGAGFSTTSGGDRDFAVVRYLGNPTVAIRRDHPSPTNAASVDFSVDFSEAVQNVDASDFALNKSGTVNGTIAAVTGSGSMYTVTVNMISGDGTLGLDLVAGTDIEDTTGSSPVSTTPTVDEVYTIDNTPPADTEVRLDGSGNLVVEDTGAASADLLTIQSDTAASRFVISDPNNVLSTMIPGATQVDDHTIHVPFSAVTGPSILVDTFGGDDSLTVDFSEGDFSKTIQYDGGADSDDLTLTGGGSFSSVEHTFQDASRGQLNVSGNQTISYTGLEPVTDNLDAADRVFNFTGGMETVTLSDSGGADGQMTIDSTLGESVTFANPTSTLVITTLVGTGPDTVELTGLDDAFAADLTVLTDTIEINGELAGANEPVSLAAREDIVANSSLQNDGTGAVNLVGGWDGVTGPTGSTFDMSAVFANAASFGNGGGSVFVGDGAQASGIAVGSRFGETNLAASGLTLLASDTTAEGFAQLGYRVDSSQADFDIDGPIEVHLKADLVAQAGMMTGTYAQLGHGGRDPDGFVEPDGNFSGSIMLAGAGNVTFTAGSGSDAYAQLGHGGASADGNHGGAIDVSNTGDLTFTAGDESDAYAHLGHGGEALDGDMTGDISLTNVGNLDFTAGSDGDAYAQLGHGGDSLDGDMSGAIAITGAGSFNFSAGSATDAFAQLGHGGDVVAGDHTGAIEISNAGDLNFIAGTDGFDAYAQLGHGGDASDGTFSGAISITDVGALNFTGGTIDSQDAYAQLGHGGDAADGNHDGPITITGAADLVFTGGTEIDAYAQLGHGGHHADGNQDGAITISATGDLSVGGGSGERAYAQIGHGDASGIATGTREGDIDLAIAGETSLVNGTGADAPWLIGHATATALGISDAAVTLASGTLDFDDTAASTLFDIAADADGADFAAKMIANLAGGDVTLAATNTTLGPTGGMGIASPFSYTSDRDLNFLSAADIGITAAVDNSGSGDVALAADRHVTGTAAGTLSTGGAIVITGDADMAGGGSIMLAGDVASGVSVTASLTDLDGLISGVISEMNPASEFVKNGAGTLELSAANTYTGTTTIHDGMLLVTGSIDGSVGTVEVESGATLGGTGMIGTTVNLGACATLSPGTSAGTLTIDGNYTQGDGTLLIEIGGTMAGSEHDQLVVTGTAFLSGTLEVELTGGFTPDAGDSFLVLDGTTSGSFDVHDLPPLPAGLDWQVDISSVTLNVVDVMAPSVTSITADPVVITEDEVGTATFTITVMYDEPMDQSVAPTVDFPVEDPSATISQDLPASDWTNARTYVAVYDVVDVNEELADVDVTISSAEDLTGNVQSSHTESDVFSIDTVRPTAGITRDDPNPTSADTVNFSVDFSEDVQNVDANDFELDTSATVSGSISGVTGSGSVYTVTVGAISGDGTLGLDFAAGTDIEDTAGNPVSTTPTEDEVYTIDNTPPEPVFFDYGDAPDGTTVDGVPRNYPTLSANNGAVHELNEGPFLGTVFPDAEDDGQPTATADGDDADAEGDDEDGVIGLATPLVPGTTHQITVTTSGGSGLLNAFVDFNLDGDWDDAGEQVFTDEALASGTHNLSFNVPAGAAAGTTFARFRLSTQSGLGFDGPAPDGEVEDYTATIESPPEPVLDFSVNPVLIDEGGSITLTGSFDNGPGPHTVIIDWDDGQTDTLDLAPGDSDFSASHTYLDDTPSGTPLDTNEIVVSVVDQNGSPVVDGTSLVVVRNVPPVFTSLSLTPTTLPSGSLATLSGTFSDPGVLDQFVLDIDLDGDGTYDSTDIPVSGGAFSFNVAINQSPGMYQVNVRLRDDDGGATSGTLPVTVTPPPAGTFVQDVHLFYNNSSFDGNNPAADANDDDAIAQDKFPFTPGETSTFGSISSYDKGINGVILYVQDLPNNGADVGADNFNILVGASDDLDTWAAGPAPQVTVTPGAGPGGADQVTLIFPDNSVEDTYVAIQILAGPETGLAQTETYLFGSVVGETGQTAVPPPFPFFGRGSGDFASIASDVTPLAQFGTEPITNPHDINRDGTVAVQDILITSAAGVNPTVLPEITPFFGALGMAALAVDEAVREDAADVLLADDVGRFTVDQPADRRVDDQQEEDERDLAFATFETESERLFDAAAAPALAIDRLAR